MEWHYDSKYGFKHASLTLSWIGAYECYAKSGVRESVAYYHLFIQRKTILNELTYT